MDTGANGHQSTNGNLGQIGTWKNEYLGKWVLEENIYLGELGIGEMGTGANGLLAKWTFGGNGFPKCPNIPVFISPQMFANGQ